MLLRHGGLRKPASSHGRPSLLDFTSSPGHDPGYGERDRRQRAGRGMSAAGLVAIIRLIGGMVLMLFVACHLSNLALGLHSLDLLEAWRPRVLAALQTYPGLALLYGALGSHLVLGLVALAKRRSTASFRATDLAQLV